MESLVVGANLVLGLIIVAGAKFGVFGALALPAAVALTRVCGERFFAIYAAATTAGIGMALASMLGRLAKLAPASLA